MSEKFTCQYCGAELESPNEYHDLADCARYMHSRIAELEKALNIDTDLTIAGLRMELRNATARLAELEAESERFTVHSDIERQDDKWIPEVTE